MISLDTNPSLHIVKVSGAFVDEKMSPLITLPTSVETLKLVSELPSWKLPNPIPINESEKRMKKDSLKNLYFLSPPPQ